MTKRRKVVFGRINRRKTDTLGETRSFLDDMRDLAASKRTSYTIRSTSGSPSRTWHAADMRIVGNDSFLIGILGYSVSEERRLFDADEFSWIKGQTEFTDAASEDTVIPFAIDLRNSNRWVCLATAPRIMPYSAAANFGRVLNHAVHAMGLLGSDWECDLVVSKSSIRQWIAEHPRIKHFRRTIKFSNPGLDLDDDRNQMRALGANRKTEEFAPARNQILDVSSEVFESKIDGSDTGDVEVTLKAMPEGGATPVFRTKENADQSYIEDYGTDLVRGMDLVLNALMAYSSLREPDLFSLGDG